MSGDGLGASLIATEAVLEATWIEPAVASDVSSARKAGFRLEPVRVPKNTKTAEPVAIGAAAKQALILAMLQ